MSSPQQYVDRLTALAEAARHHPEPAVAVSLLCQLLLDVVKEIQPITQKYGLVLRTGGALAVLEALEQDLAAAELQLAATSLPGAQAGTYEDLQTNVGSIGRDGRDTTSIPG